MSIPGALLGNVTRLPVIFERGEGVWLYDTDGKRYLDMLGGIAVAVLGHGHPGLTAALREQAGRLLHVSNLFYTPEGLAAADALVARLGEGKVYFCNSGTEANEAALKAARKHAWRRGERDRTAIVAVDGSFHGRTYGSLAATMQPAKWEGFGPMPARFQSVPLNDVDALDAAVDERTAAVIIEPIQGEAGIRPLTSSFAQAARRLTAERGALLVADEIQTGVGRTGRWWGFEHLGIRPDIVTMAKALGGGYPVGATWIHAPVTDALQPGDHATTQGGGPLAGAAVCAVLDAIEREGLLDNAVKVGERLSAELGPLGAEVRGRGLLLALELGRDVAGAVVEAGLERGVVVNAVTPSAIRLAPPLTMTEQEALEGVACLREAIEAVG